MLRIPRPTKRPPVPGIIYAGTEENTYLVYIKRVMFQIEQDVYKIKASSFKLDDDAIMFYSGGQSVAMFNRCDVEKIIMEEPTAQAVEE